MDRNYGEELDRLKDDLAQIKELLLSRTSPTTPSPPTPPTPPLTPQQAYIPFQRPIDVMRDMHENPVLNDLMVDLCIKTADEKDSGKITYMGVFASGNRQSNWIRDEVSADVLLDLIQDKGVSRILQSIGSLDKLTLLVSLLKEPQSVQGLIQSCGYTSTGQVYHHLRPLLDAGLLQEGMHVERGKYVVVPHRVQGIMMVLCGIYDMITTQDNEPSHVRVERAIKHWHREQGEPNPRGSMPEPREYGRSDESHEHDRLESRERRLEARERRIEAREKWRKEPHVHIEPRGQHFSHWKEKHESSEDFEET